MKGRAAANAGANAAGSTTRFRWRDLLNEAVSGLVERRGRTALTVVGAALGITAFVASLGLSRTAGSQILVRLDRLQATAVEARLRVATPGSPLATGASAAGTPLVADAIERAVRIKGVASASVLSRVPKRGLRIRAGFVRDLANQPSLDRDVLVASPDLLQTIGGTFASGRMFDRGNDERSDSVCVLGARLADALGVPSVEGSPAVFVGQRAFTVLGIIRSVDRRDDILDSVIVPEGVAAKRLGYVGPSNLLVKTDVGAAEIVANQLATVLSPENPIRVDVRTGQQARIVRKTTERDLDALFFALGAVVAVIGALSIANVTLVSVYERVGEIGLRRSLGARPIHIASQFLMESTVLGVLGGVVGTSLGVIAIVGMSAVRGWTPVLEGSLLVLAPIVGAAVGLLSGVWPSVRAARMQPVDALRRGT